MKRSAENQLTKDGQYDDDEEIEEIEGPAQGFQKADESVLAKRQIRALPKRVMAGAPAKAASFNGFASSPTPASDAGKEAPNIPKFGGFAGFGAGPSSNQFTFTVTPSSTAPDATKTSGPHPAGSFRAAVYPPAPGTAPASKIAISGTAEEKDPSALKYYKSLRGLNVSFLSAITKAVEQDPFVDITSLLESYKNLRTTIQSEFDSSQSTIPSTGSSSVFGAKAPASEKPSPAAAPFTLPKPPAAFTGFGVPPSITPKPASAPESSSVFGSSTTKTNGFSFPTTTPSAPSAQLPFSLTPKPSESSASSTSLPQPPKAPFTFGTSATDDSKSSKPSGFSFATPPSTTTAQTQAIFGLPTKDTDSTATTAPSLQPTPASSVFAPSGVPNFFANSKVNATTPSDSSSKPTSVFGSSIFGSKTGDSSRSSLLFGAASDSSKTSDKVETPKDAQAPISLFGGTAAGAPAPSDKAVSVFGSSSPPKIFGFGKPGGSIGNPVGFAFGGPSGPTSQGDNTGPGSSTSFTFGAPPAKPTDNLATTDKSTESTPQPENNEGGEDESARLLPTSNHDEEGEGEEDEETMHVVRCKAFRLMKMEDKSEWKDYGIGMLRLKKHKETGVRRVLMRNSSTGRILINFRLYSGLRPTLAKTSISFVGHDNGTPASFRIRVKTEEQAAELKEAIDREIAAFQAAE